MDAAASNAAVWPLVFYIIAVLGVCGLMLTLAFVFGGRVVEGRATQEQYESGIVPAGSSRLRLSAKFYLVAMFFVIFDLEAAYLYAWAVVARDVGWAGYIEAVVFTGVLAVGLVYLWKLGALDWAPRQGLRKRKLPGAH